MTTLKCSPAILRREAQLIRENADAAMKPKPRKTALSFSAAHAWLRGYSDALRGVGDVNAWSDYRADYERGNRVGNLRAKP